MSSEQTPHLVIGTAGHIDHGKTTLVKALTGTDTDRLEEEKRRGITIELGFAFYGDRAAFVDVPGHEKLVRTMVAGAAAMNAALLVVAADDGIMPQTLEHLAVLDALGVEQGVVAITKAGLAESEEWIELVVEEIRELLVSTTLAESPIVVTDALEGRGLDELRQRIDELIERAAQPYDPGFFRLPIDRSFLIKGHGRVITGTVWSGEATSGDRLILLPAGEEVRVRSVQAHEKTVQRVRQGDRAALNLAPGSEPERGDVLLTPGRGVCTEFLDARLRLLPGARAVEHRQRVRVHLGTAEVIGRLLIVGGDAIAPGESGWVRIALESPVSVMSWDRGVLRLYSPLETLGGIRVLDPKPPDRRRTLTGLVERLIALNDDTESAVLEMIRTRRGIEFKQLAAMVPLALDELEAMLVRFTENGAVVTSEQPRGWAVDSAHWANMREQTLRLLEQWHQRNPDEPGMSKGEWADQVFGGEAGLPGEALLSELTREGKLTLQSGRLVQEGHVPTLRAADEADANRVLEALAESGLNSPRPQELAEQLGLEEERVRTLLRSLKQVGHAVILAENVIVTRETYDEAFETLCAAVGESAFTAGEASQRLGTTRKYIIPLLEAFDRDGLTLREGDKRTVVR